MDPQPDPRPDLRVGPDTLPAAVVARAAYAAGWAASGGPLTDRVRAGATTAVRLAVEHANEPGVWEATLHLGALEGVWARIYARRDTVYTRQDKTVGDAWHLYLAHAIDPAVLARTARRAAGLAETTTDADTDRRDRVIAAVLALLLGLLVRQPDPGNETRRAALVDAIQGAIHDGVAEGTAGAVALAAQRAGYNSVDFDAAYGDALAAVADPAHAAYYQTQAGSWLKRMTQAVATTLGGRLADRIGDGADDTDLADDVTTYGTAATTPAVKTHTDWLVGTAFGVGLLGVFTALGLGAVNWVSVGDGKVCPRCRANESGSPYPRAAAPMLPAHPNCRCTLEPAGPVDSLKAFAKYVIRG